jgi:Family of unknown function (DUF6082)
MLWIAGLLVAILVMILAGVGVAALLAERGGSADWSRWSDVGQTFGALGSIISGMTLVALVATARAQSREMHEHRRELEQQRHSLADNYAELRRTTTAAFRRLHLEILRMSIEDPTLAKVWPPFGPNISSERNKQFLYANIIYQFQFTSLHSEGYTAEQALTTLQYLFTSQVMRDFWKASANARSSLLPQSAEYAFAQRVDEVCRQFDAVVASAGKDAPDESRLVREWQTSEQAA